MKNWQSIGARVAVEQASCVQWLGCLWLSLSLAGCSPAGFVSGFFGDDDKGPDAPAQLGEFANRIVVDTLWSKDLGAGADEQDLALVVAVDGSSVFAADREGKVTAFDAETGRELWINKTKALISAGPGVGEGLVLVGTSDAEVIAVAQESGEALWRSSVSSEVLAVPKIASGIVVARTVDGKVFGLDAIDGERKWLYERTVPALNLRGVGAPVLDRGMAIAGFANGKLVALDLHDGRELWEATIAAAHGRSDLERMVDIDADPVIVDNLVFAATFQGQLAAVDMISGMVLWRREFSSHAGMGAARGRLYVTDEQSDLWCFDQNSSASLWRQSRLHKRRLTAPVAVGDYLAVGDFEGYVHWFDQKDGRLLARLRIDDEGISNTPAIVEDVLYVYGNGGALAALRVSGG